MTGRRASWLEQPALFAVAMATLVAPNLPELRALGPSPQDLLAFGVGAVLVTGGHAESDDLVDVLVTADGERSILGRRVHGVDPRGTGCALTTAIAASLARGTDLVSSVEGAISAVRDAVVGCAARARATWPGVPIQSDGS